jgi:hypothetical protein
MTTAVIAVAPFAPMLDVARQRSQGQGFAMRFNIWLVVLLVLMQLLVLVTGLTVAAGRLGLPAMRLAIGAVLAAAAVAAWLAARKRKASEHITS